MAVLQPLAAWIRGVRWGVSLLTCMLACMALAGAAPVLSSDARAQLERAISQAAETGPTSWRAAGASGSITPGRTFQKDTLRECDACADRCRHIEYTVVQADTTSGYKGARCRDETGGWHQASNDQLMFAKKTPSNGMVSGFNPDTALDTVGDDDGAATKPSTRRKGVSVSEIQRDLKALMYYRGSLDGRFTTATKKALDAFLQDERVDMQSVPSVAVLGALRTAVRRQTHGTCPKPENVEAIGLNVVCGVLTD